MSKKPIISDANNPLKRKAVEIVDPYNPVQPPIKPIEETQKPEPKKVKDKSDLKQYGTYLRPETVKHLRQHALDKDLKDYEVVQVALDEYLDKHK
jgi:hypothetical protein